jgi:hypothetical protein
MFGIGQWELLLIGLVCCIMLAPVIALLAVAAAAYSQRQRPSSNLTPCPDCGRLVSKMATACPQCGRPLGQKSN